MNWGKQLNKILGFFWLHVWKDSWLILLLSKFLLLLIGRNLINRLETIQVQTRCTSLSVPLSIRYLPIYVDSERQDKVLKISLLSLGISSLDSTLPGNVYDILLRGTCPSCIRLRISDVSTQLLPGIDFTWDITSISFRKPLSEYGFDTKFIILSGKIKKCYTLWAVYNTYTTLLDKFTSIMELPTLWIYKYPNAVLAAWSIKQNGANLRDTIKLLAAIGGYYLLGGIRYPSIYTYKTGLPADLPGIHVVTDAGMLYALNSTVSTNSGILPLKQDISGNLSTLYTEICNSRSLNLKIPSATIPNVINPASFIFNQVWGACATLLLVPPTNRTDMLKAISFILNNMMLGCILLAYTKLSTGYKLLYPDILKTNSLLTYYRTSINNNTEYTERHGSFEQGT